MQVHSISIFLESIHLTAFRFFYFPKIPLSQWPIWFSPSVIPENYFIWNYMTWLFNIVVHSLSVSQWFCYSAGGSRNQSSKATPGGSFPFTHTFAVLQKIRRYRTLAVSQLCIFAVNFEIVNIIHTMRIWNPVNTKLLATSIKIFSWHFLILSCLTTLNTC